jgi:hypothetical protein
VYSNNTALAFSVRIPKRTFTYTSDSLCTLYNIYYVSADDSMPVPLRALIELFYALGGSDTAGIGQAAVIRAPDIQVRVSTVCYNIAL